MNGIPATCVHRDGTEHPATQDADGLYRLCDHARLGWSAPGRQPNGRSVVIATDHFRRTRCLACPDPIRAGQALVSTAEGFRHLGCAMTK